MKAVISSQKKKKKCSNKKKGALPIFSRTENFEILPDNGNLGKQQTQCNFFVRYPQPFALPKRSDTEQVKKAKCMWDYPWTPDSGLICDTIDNQETKELTFPSLLVVSTLFTLSSFLNSREVHSTEHQRRKRIFTVRFPKFFSRKEKMKKWREPTAIMFRILLSSMLQ